MYNKIKDFQILIVAGIIAVTFLIITSILVTAIKKETISVTGSAFKQVKSDVAVLKFSIKAKNFEKAKAYKLVKSQTPVIIDFLQKEGIKENEITFLTANSYPSYRYETKNGYSANIFEGYNFEQTIIIKSNNVDKIKELSLSAQSLLDSGIDINIQSPEYYYSKLSEIKIALLKEASEDAKQRAKGMLSATNNKVGKINSVRMGVFQITPADSTEVSDYGMNDTSSLEKKVTAVANVVFGIK